MPFLREMSREKIRKKEKNPPKKSSGGCGILGTRAGGGSWTPVSGGREGQDGGVGIVTLRIIL
jgi:hypothetical protein